MVAEYEPDGWLFWELSSSGSWQEVQFLEELALLWHQEEQGESVPWLQCLESSRAQRDANGRHDCSFVAVKSSNGDVFLSSHPPLTCALHLTNTRKLGKNSIKTKNCQIVLWRLKIEKKNKPTCSVLLWLVFSIHQLPLYFGRTLAKAINCTSLPRSFSQNKTKLLTILILNVRLIPLPCSMLSYLADPSSVWCVTITGQPFT